MAIDISQTLQIMQDKLLRDLGDEVDLIFCFGSQLTGTTHQYSDVDICFVPTHESTRYSITVVVDNMLIDLFPMRWSQLEYLANFGDPRCTLLLKNEIVYQRDDTVGKRFRALAEQVNAMLTPDARPMMLKKAFQIFEKTGYSYYLLRQQVQDGHLLAAMQQAQTILNDILHCLVVCNQSVIDTRKLDQVLALPRLPENLADTVDKISNATDVNTLLVSCEALLQTTRELLLNEQQDVLRHETSFPVVLRGGYPELKGDIQHLMLACERRDMFDSRLISLYHELMIHMAQAITGIEYSSFNCIPDYEQDLAALGFPDLLSYVVARDFEGLHQQCQKFDQHLQQFLLQKSVGLNQFDNTDALKAFLDENVR